MSKPGFDWTLNFLNLFRDQLKLLFISSPIHMIALIATTSLHMHIHCSNEYKTWTSIFSKVGKRFWLFAIAVVTVVSRTNKISLRLCAPLVYTCVYCVWALVAVCVSKLALRRIACCTLSSPSRCSLHVTGLKPPGNHFQYKFKLSVQHSGRVKVCRYRPMNVCLERKSLLV